MSMTIQQHAPESEHCTASLNFHVESGENFDAPICIGVYPGSPNEIWLEFDTARINIAAADVPAFCKELKRAAAISAKIKP